MFLLMAAAVSLAPAVAVAQGRGSVSVGSLRSVGSQSSFGSSTFRNYSYGLSSPAAGSQLSPATGMNSTYGLQRSTGGAGTATGLAAPIRPQSTSGSQRIYQPTRVNYRSPGSGSVTQEAKRMAANRVSFGQDLRTAFGLTASPLLTDQPIHSFAPNNPGSYAAYLRAGQDAMKVRQYIQATEHFRQAHFIAPQRPETLLSLAHAEFGAGRYSSMGHHLRLTIRHTPDLPSRDIRIRSFFRDVSTFLALRDELIAQTEAVPKDSSQWMALGYVLWYDNDAPRAADAWRRAYAVSIDPTMSQAIEAWWDGAIATGRISGPLEAPPAPPPLAVAEPAADAATASDAADR